jgi:glycosyltransferase involved in cell wall biosynthesis
MYSVIIPTHNRPDTLARAVRSAQAQSVPPGEILVADDASEPPVDAAALPGGPAPVRVIRTAKAGGAPRARNLGLDAAAHGFAAFLDDDDEWLPQKMERQLDCLRRRPELVAACCGRWMVGGSGESREVLSEALCNKLFWYDNLFGSFSFLTVRLDERAHGLRLDPDMPACQDWDFLARLREKGPVGMVEEPLCRLYLHVGPRITSNYANRARGLRRFMERYGDRMPPGAQRWVRGRLHFLESHLPAPWPQCCARVMRGTALLLASDFPIKRRLTTTTRYVLEAVLGPNRAEAIKVAWRRRCPGG